MGFLDVERFFQLIHDEITDDEKENLFSELCSAEITTGQDTDFLLKLFKISQEILKFKGEQVESLVSELDALAVKLGEEEAKRCQNFLEVEEFRAPTDEKHSSTNAEDLDRKLMKIEIQKNRLIAVLQEKEEELVSEKKELENFSRKILVLEEENKSLKSELQSLQQELASNASLKLISDDQDYFSMDKYNELSELLRQKNKHITQLLNDIEDIERENIILKDKLSIVKDELLEGAEQMSKLSMERISLSACVDDLNGKVLKLEQENLGLRNQISELIIDKETRDTQFENMNSSYESKIQQWKNLLQLKEMELSSVKYRQVSGNSNQKFDESSCLTQLSNLNKTLTEREEKILELQQQLEQATMDLNENTRLLEEQKIMFQSKFDRNFESNAIKTLRKLLDQAEDRITILEAKVKYAEEESFRKAQEVTNLIIQLREYESGTYGLEEAMIRIKDLQKQKQVRDTQIEQLVRNLNQLQDEDNLLEHENQILREKLGLGPGEQIVTEDFSRHNLRKQNKVSILNHELEKSHNEVVELKLENRKLNQQITSLMVELNFYRLKEPLSNGTEKNNFSFDQDFPNNALNKTVSIAVQSTAVELGSDGLNENEKFKTLIDENESLRKGMHEILDSIRNQDGSSLIRIESNALERLLEALDGRHVSGWYQPGMRLQARIQHLYGMNEALREELFICRSHEGELLHELRDTQWKIEKLQDNSKHFEFKISPPSPKKHAKCTKLKNITSCSDKMERSDEFEKLSRELLGEKDRCKNLDAEIKEHREKFSLLEEEINKLRKSYDADKENWCSVKTAMLEEIDNSRNNESILLTKITDYEKGLEILKKNPEEINKTFIETMLSMSSLKIEHERLSRKFHRLLEMENQIRQDKNKLSDEICSLKYSKNQKIIELKKINEQLNLELKEQLLLSNENINQQDYVKVVRDFNDVTVKYRELQQRQILLQSQKDQLMLKLQNKISSLQSQKVELEILMKAMMEEIEIHRCSASNVSVSDKLTSFSKRIAELEMNETNKIQQLEHCNRMYKLTKEQLTETENRCKHLENQLLIAVQMNGEFQKNEAALKEEIMRLPTNLEYELLKKKLVEAESNVAELRLREVELKELADIAQDQVKVIERYNRYQDSEYDSLQRRILELQSLSDEKMIIDRLTKELLHLQQNGNNATNETKDFKDKLTRTESKMLRLRMKLNETENNYKNLKRDSNIKTKYMHAVIYELQKRYLGAYPLVKEELCVKSLLDCREECILLTSLILNFDVPSVLKSENDEDQEGVSYNRRKTKKNALCRSEFCFEDFSLKLMNEGLQNKLHIFAERLERQDKLISRLEEEIIHADEQCQEFLLYWNASGDSKFLNKTVENTQNKFTQTMETETSKEIKIKESSDGEPTDEIYQETNVIQKLKANLQTTEGELCNLREKLMSAIMELKEKEIIISSRDEEILRWQQIGLSNEDHQQSDGSDGENSIKKLALKATIDSMQNIIQQKEEIIVRQQNMLKKKGEEHAQNILQLVREIKAVQNAMDLKEQAYNRLKIKFELNEKPPNEKRCIIDSYLSKIHELEDELNQANEKIEQLSNQVLTSKQQAELWSHTAEERLKSLQNMSLVTNPESGEFNLANQNSIPSLMQSLKEKNEEIERLQQLIEERKKHPDSSEKLMGYRDRLRNELERYKKKVDILEHQEKEDKAEIQRLKNQILARHQSVRKKETIMSPREEQLMKKIRSLEEEVNAYVEKEKNWKELRQTRVDEEMEKWQHKKQCQQIFEKLQHQLKNATVQCESQTAINARLKRTITRLEKERMNLECKLKIAKSHVSNFSMIEELQKTNSRLEHELEVLRRSAQFSMGTTSLTNVIEAQERKINALEITQKGDSALADELERLNERKIQLQKYNVRLEEENLHLKMDLEKVKSDSRKLEKLSESKFNVDDLDNQLCGNRRKNVDLEKAVLVLRRVVEKLQAENKRLQGSRVPQIQDVNHVDKLNAELHNLQENYLDAIEKTSALDKELQTAQERINSLEKLIVRLQSGEELSSLKSQIAHKNQLLIKVKNLLEKAALREKELLLKVHDLQKLNGTTG